MSVKALGIRTALPVLVGVFVTGCGNFLTASVDCPSWSPPAISVTVEHAATGEPVNEALVIAEEGAFVDSATTYVSLGSDQAKATLARDRAGTYSVRVEKPGFVEWSRNGVEVTMGECHVTTVRLVARLEPSPS